MNQWLCVYMYGPCLGESVAVCSHIWAASG